ncbi:hypothetical protein [Streptomyces sp. SBT349]|uniref:hypothetical protein n=1 Tax=Streptomyces sp. SBT349 TaxID=1580539 RepID=UPI00069F4D18|nr:hypothetical protein [Streptomyces sp. SBT349]
MTPPPTILGVHGIGNHQPGATPDDAAALLSGRWGAALGRPLRVAYYAHHLAPGLAQGVDEPEWLAAEERLLLLALARNLGAPAEVAQGRLTAPARRAADWIARRHGLDARLVGRFVARFCREVDTYFRDADRRAAARDEVARRLAEAAPRVVIAHSLGSVVAYEALHAHPHPPVELLITLGSPLGMPDVVHDRLVPAPPGHRPPGVRRWVNIADPGDLVALPRHLATRFAGVDADVETTIATFDFHKVTHYLACPATTTAVAVVG